MKNNFLPTNKEINNYFKNKDMKNNVKLAIEEYQCTGCIVGSNTECFKINETGGVGCGKHNAGTFLSNIGKIYLGLPHGFNRLGFAEKMKPNIYDTFESSDWEYGMWNVPVWKYLTENNHTIVRGIMPRKNEPFIHIFLENCIDKINCLEITKSDIDGMD